MLAQGPSFDYRRLPLGRSLYAGVPFEIVDPAQNNWKSMILVADAVKTQLVPGAQSSVSIPIGRKAASLCALRSLIRKDPILGGQYDFWGIMLPAYIFEYSDGTRYVCDRELARHYLLIVAQGFPQGIKPYRTFGPGGGTAGWGQGGPLRYFMWPSTRIGLFSNTLGGNGAYLFLNEFVNPYPQKEIQNLIIQLPNPEQKFNTYAWHEALFALTGVEPTEWDLNYWLKKTCRPLLPPNPILSSKFEPLLAVCQKDERTLIWTDAKTHAQTAALKSVPNSALPTWQLILKGPVHAGALTFRLSMPPGGGTANRLKAMPVWYRHTDCKIFGSNDDKTWTLFGEIKGCTGMDGNHVVTFASQELSTVKFILNSEAYLEEENTEIGIIDAEVYVEKHNP
jgi:hypothetical protein